MKYKFIYKVKTREIGRFLWFFMVLQPVYSIKW